MASSVSVIRLGTLVISSTPATPRYQALWQLCDISLPRL
uniref:Uncharacterized protein n=1 Tax=Arundo donax TaxID=35708 RepID=A0A0A9BQJ5_ARUDO